MKPTIPTNTPWDFPQKQTTIPFPDAEESVTEGLFGIGPVIDRMPASFEETTAATTRKEPHADL